MFSRKLLKTTILFIDNFGWACASKLALRSEKKKNASFARAAVEPAYMPNITNSKFRRLPFMMMWQSVSALRAS